MIHPVRSTLSLALAAGFLAGCEGFSPHRQDQVGSAHVAVLSVAPWEDCVDAVQPTFKLTPEEALAQAVPTTRSLEEKVLDAFAARGKVALPGTTFTDTSTLSDLPGHSPEESRQRTETTTSGDASRVQSGASPAGSRTATGLPPGTSVLATPLGVDPFLKYWAATALYEEVQLINRYLRDAAIEDEYIPYVVRLQISLLPKVRGQPYDADAVISVFLGDWDSGPPPLVTEAVAPTDGCKSASTVLGVKILPLLVTDNLEATIQSRSVDQIRELALALSATIQGVGAGADLQKIDEKLRTSLGRDLNATFTVARVSDNTLRCRIGAVQEPTGGYAMIPQTHNVSLLVLVPRKNDKCDAVRCSKLHLACRTLLTNAKTGEPLPARDRLQTYQAVREVLRTNNVQGYEQADSAAIEHVIATATANNFDEFKSALKAITKGDSPKFPEAIWVEVIAVRNGSVLSSASFEVPKLRAVALKPTIQTVLLVDDGKSAVTATVHGGSSLRAAELRGTLTVDKRSFPSTGVRVSDNGKEVQLTFPSLTALSLVPKDLDSPTLTLTSVGKRPGTQADLLTNAPCRFIAKPAAPQPGFKMAATSGFVIAQNGTGSVQLTFVPEKDATPDMQFSVQGADIADILPPGSATRVGARWKVPAAAAITLKFSNLTALSAVRIKAVDDSNKADLPEIALPVIERPEQSNRSGGGTAP